MNLGYHNLDCMEGMKEFPDKYFELAIVDVPYGLGMSGRAWHSYADETVIRNGRVRGEGLAKPIKYKISDWDNKVPSKEYFNELGRVSVNQIIFGGNYFDLGKTSCYIVWDKNNDGSNFADCELLWTSFKSAVRIFRYTWRGMLQ